MISVAAKARRLPVETVIVHKFFPDCKEFISEQVDTHSMEISNQSPGSNGLSDFGCNAGIKNRQ